MDNTTLEMICNRPDYAREQILNDDKEKARLRRLLGIYQQQTTVFMLKLGIIAPPCAICGEPIHAAAIGILGKGWKHAHCWQREQEGA